MKACLDPGHGGKDPGACDHGIRECDLNLALSLEMRPILERLGVEVVLTRETDIHLGLISRCTIANKAKVDAFISVHHNASGTADPEHASSGIETFALPGGRAEVLAGKIQRFMVAFTGSKDRGVKTHENFLVLRKTAMPAVLVECGFVTNLGESVLLQQGTRRVRLACAIAAGLMTCNEGVK